MKDIVLAVTGASGSIYALKFALAAKEADCRIHLMFSHTGRHVALHELGDQGVRQLETAAFKIYDTGSFWQEPASGSSVLDAMVILPCTMGTLGAIANGISINLVHRAADCFLKEKKPLVAAVRETPLNRIHLENMLRLSRAGGVIFPAMPAFYTRPESIDELACGFAGRIIRFLGMETPDLRPWTPEAD